MEAFEENYTGGSSGCYFPLDRRREDWNEEKAERVDSRDKTSRLTYLDVPDEDWSMPQEEIRRWQKD